MNKFLPFIIFIFVFIFFWQFFLKGLLPIPSDTIVGLYHPFRDLYAKDYPNGIPYKNFLITDPVRQQYPWKKLSIDALKKGELPLWNPYEMAGKPLLANFQSGVFYPLNILFFVLPFNTAWSLLIIIQPLLAIYFTYLFLRNLKLSEISSLFGGFVFAFSGFSIAWLEWGNILNTAIWLPLTLLSIDKILNVFRFKWPIVLIFSICSSFFAGHLQIFFYLLTTSIAYFIFRWIEKRRDKKILLQFFICCLIFVILTSIQWLPTLKFITESARSIDQTWTNEGWFIPWQNIIQFIAPDFFGNPSTLNYWGVWNYGEFIGYVGIIPLILSLFALFFKKDKNILFFGLIFFVSLIFAFPTFLAKIPYILNLPFFSTAQPTRMLFLADFSLAILASYGLENLKKSKRQVFYPLVFIGLVLGTLWLVVVRSADPNFLVSRQNLLLPSILFILALLAFIFRKKASKLTVYILFLITVIDLFRFGWKFTPFTAEKYLFPETQILSVLSNKKDHSRVMSLDSRILPPNFSSIYKIQSVEGYDPLFVESFGELIAASERGAANINPPFGFNRIITPHKFESEIINLSGVRYVLSLNEINSPQLEKVVEEGQTRLYENKNYFPRAFFVKETISLLGKQDVINSVFQNKDKLMEVAVVEGLSSSKWSTGKATIVEYKENSIIIETENESEGFLVLTDTFYPTWKASIDGKNVKILRTDLNFRGVVVPSGNHSIKFYSSLW